MNTGFSPINLLTKPLAQDTSSLRQNQPYSKAAGGKTPDLATAAPQGNDLASLIESALEMKKQNVNMDRGSLLNILA